MTMAVQLLVLAKAPVPGLVKTRLCPPCTPEHAAAVAAAALRDTFHTVDAAPAAGRALVVSGDLSPPPGWAVVAQRGDGLADRLANAFADTAAAGLASLIVGMDTPHMTPELLTRVADGLRDADAVLGPALDGGWWTLALRDPSHAEALRCVPMSTKDTGRLTAEALRRGSLVVALGPTLQDVDTAADARAIAAQHPHTQFAAAVREHLPAEGHAPR
jgi:glycosyltransferase A (GT-A) superfamily protein (DUF2064 family)